uniref:Uncharacterized protein n=1 Tax=Psilocybe cubensis TaxID=181762 RepID=A0A8H7XX64_PSICU
MYPTLRCSSARAHTPLIKFLGKRTYPSTPDAPHPHPAAPAELRQRIADFIAKHNSPQPTAPSTNIYNDFWEAPSRFWKPRIRQIEEDEMNAIMSGGASSH